MKDFIKTAFNYTVVAAAIMGFSVWIGVGVGRGFVTGMRWAL